MEATKVREKTVLDHRIGRLKEHNKLRRTTSNQTLELLNGFSYIQTWSSSRKQTSKVSTLSTKRVKLSSKSI